MNTNKSSILRGIGYSFAQAIVSWIVFYLFVCSINWNSDFFLFFVFAIWLLAIPFYFMGKNNCNAFFLLFAFITNPIVSYIMLLVNGTLANYLPYFDGWGIYIPLVGIPIIGAIPIAIDALLYLIKWIWKALGNRKDI